MSITIEYETAGRTENLRLVGRRRTDADATKIYLRYALLIIASENIWITERMSLRTSRLIIMVKDLDASEYGPKDYRSRWSRTCSTQLTYFYYKALFSLQGACEMVVAH